jgi:hypothetical protein
MNYGKLKHETGQLKQAASELMEVLREDNGEVDWQTLFFLSEALESASKVLTALPEEIVALSGYSSQAGTQATAIDGVVTALKALSETIRTA